jgi:NAD(P)-dependent dehydrogenase (short-subunit alcohol dehydrogenase family)
MLLNARIEVCSGNPDTLPHLQRCTSMELNLKDRVAFITGANRGIGAGIAGAFAAEGVHLGLFARNVQQCEDMAEQIRASTKVRISVQYIDFGRPETLVPAVSGAIEILGGVDILVNCAGGAKRGHFHEVSDEDWETCFSVKPLGLIRMTRAVLPYLERSNQPRIINLAGTRGREPSAFSAVAGPINMGTLSLTKLMANDLGSKGITVNAINPGSTNTRRWADLVQVYAHDKNVSHKEAEKILVEEIPLGRVVEIQDIADLAIFLASARARMITGTAINVDGGRSRSI